MSLSNGVWERGGGYDEMSDRNYVAAVSGFTTYGLILASILAYLTTGWKPDNILVYLGIGLIIPVIGIFIALKSDNWLISLVGYTMVVAGLGIITGPAVAMYKLSTVMTALMATAGVTFVTSVVGIIYPRLLNGWGVYLFGALVALVLVRVAQIIMASLGMPPAIWNMPIIDYLAALLFTLYIIYDWGRAMQLAHTLDNAVDSAVAIFLDIINLFFTFLRIFGGSNKKFD
jgi:FtsH-binding integral membrane protein